MSEAARGLRTGTMIERDIAIIGSSGVNARPWTEAFLVAGWRVRALLRKSREVASWPRLMTATLELDDPRTYAPALEGVDVLALITPAHPAQVEREIGMIEAAREVGVPAIIKLSVLGAEISAPISPFARWAGRVEDSLRESGLGHVVLRPNAYMQNLLRQRESIVSGSYVEPLGDTAASYIDVSDIAAVAVAVANGPFDGRALDLTGPAALTGEQMAATLTSAVGRGVRFVSPPLGQFRKALTERGMPAWQVEGLGELYEAIQGGRGPHIAAVSADVAATIGRAPRSFEQFAGANFGKGDG